MSARQAIKQWAKAGDPAWQIRRRITGYTLAFCAITTLMAMLGATSEALAPTIVTSNYALAGAIIASYLTAATTDDIFKRKDAPTPDAPMLGDPLPPAPPPPTPGV